jgi:hypothetical protein
MTDVDRLIESLAEIEHEQWMAWASAIALNEAISPERLARWEKAMVPYADLPDDVKEQDREWARKVLAHPLMAEMAREAEIGRSVEKLRAVLPLGWGASLNMTQGDEDGHPYSVQVWNERVENVTDTMPDWCETVPDAVDAAIGTGDDLADPREWRN